MGRFAISGVFSLSFFKRVFFVCLLLSRLAREREREKKMQQNKVSIFATKLKIQLILSLLFSLSLSLYEEVNELRIIMRKYNSMFS
jgi:hypothetical protein